MRRGDDFVAGLNSERAHRDVERVCAIGTGDTMLHAQSFSPTLFKSFDMRSPDKG